jgi:hypothetical protein
MIEWKEDWFGLRLGLGDCADYDGDADLILGDLYGPLPAHLLSKPAIINIHGVRRKEVEGWLGYQLTEIGAWGRGYKNHVYVGNLEPKPVELGDLMEVEIAPRQGLYPFEFPHRLLKVYGWPGAWVFDPCMGRGTTGKAALALGMRFVGIDKDPQRVELARLYLGC